VSLRIRTLSTNHALFQLVVGGLSDQELTELKRRQAQLIKDGAGIRPATKSKNSAAFAEKLGT
jgi:hypothetical protein